MCVKTFIKNKHIILLKIVLVLYFQILSFQGILQLIELFLLRAQKVIEYYCTIFFYCNMVIKEIYFLFFNSYLLQHKIIDMFHPEK